LRQWLWSQNNLFTAFTTYEKTNGNTAHMSIIFNTFMLYTLFNQVNARIIDDSFNIFLDLHNNIYFIEIEICEFGLHNLLIQFSANIFKSTSGGLTGYQCGICIGFGSITFLFNIVLKLFMRPNEKNIVIKEDASNEDIKKLLIFDH
jgi:hypothetical protein